MEDREKDKKRVLFVCSANLNRSPKAEEILNSKGEDIIAKSVGLHPLAAVPISKEAIEWADIIVLMDEKNEKQKSALFEMFSDEKLKQKDIRVLGIPDIYPKEDPELEKVLINKLKEEGLV